MPRKMKSSKITVPIPYTVNKARGPHNYLPSELAKSHTIVVKPVRKYKKRTTKKK